MLHEKCMMLVFVVVAVVASRVRSADPPTPCAPQASAAEPGGSDDVRQLRAAAKRLTDLGHSELAARVSEVADRLGKEQALAGKKRDLARLQREIQKLQRDLGLGRQVLLRLQLLECKLDDQLTGAQSILQKMDAVAGETDRATKGGMFRLYDRRKIAESVLAELRKAGKVKVLAEPALVTMSGRPASLHIGGEIPVPVGRPGAFVELQKLGTLVDALPVVKPDGNIRLELRLVVRQLDEGRRTQIGEKPVPGLRTRSVNTAVEVKSGQTLVLAGLEQRSASDHESASCPTGLLLTVVTELVDPTPTAELPTPTRR